jgi:ribosomal-protein-alanine N-acetyltransferase
LRAHEEKADGESSTRFRVRAGVGEDLAEIVALERGVTEAPHWAELEYAAAIQLRQGGLRRCLFVAEAGTKLIGFAVGKVVGVGERCFAELESVAVDAKARRGGIGRGLCEAVAVWSRGQGANSLELEVRATSVGAIALYQGLGFVVEGRRGGYYEAPVDDALLMRLELAEKE